MSTFIHGIAASENIDSAGERLSIAGMDISSLDKDGVFNYEHELAKVPDKDGRPIEIQIKVPSQVVGKILKAKKIFSEKDCEDDYQLVFWQKVLVPYIYVMGVLLDDYTDAARDLAGKFRYDLDNKDINERNMMNFSIEGGKLEKAGMDVVRSVARRVTITVMPCNKAAIAEMVPADQKAGKVDADALFKTEYVEAEILDLMKTIGKPMAPKLSPTPAPMAAAPKTNLGSPIGMVGKLSVLSHMDPGHFASATPKELRTISDLHFQARYSAGKAQNPKLARWHNDQTVRFMRAADEAEKKLKGRPALSAQAPVATAPAMPGTPKVTGITPVTSAPVAQPAKTLYDPHRSGNNAPIKKSLDAGSAMCAPSQLTGMAALAKEDIRKPKKQKSKWLARAETEYNSWSKKERFEKFMAERMPKLSKGEVKAIGQVMVLNKSMDLESALENLTIPKRITQYDPMNKSAGKDSIFTLILFDGCELHDILHCSHFATNDVSEGTLDKMVAICDKYFNSGVAAHDLEFKESGELGKEGQTVLFLTGGDPYKDLFEKFKEVAEYKYSSFRPHISVTSNVDEFKGKASSLIISVNGEIKYKYDFK